MLISPKKLLLICVLLVFGGWMYFIVHGRAQNAGSTISNGSGAPGGACVSGSVYTDSATGNAWTCTGSAWKMVATAATLSGTTGSIGGGALLLGNCASGTVTVTGATAGQVAKANTSDGTFIGGSFQVQADVTSSNTVTVNVCAVVAGTPGAKSYNVKVFP